MDLPIRVGGLETFCFKVSFLVLSLIFELLIKAYAKTLAISIEKFGGLPETGCEKRFGGGPSDPGPPPSPPRASRADRTSLRCSARHGIHDQMLGRVSCYPDLLQRRPVVGCALTGKQRPSVRSLELHVHLEATVVAVAGSGSPRTLMAVNTKPLRLIRRVLRVLAGTLAAMPPDTVELVEFPWRLQPLFLVLSARTGF